MNRHLKKAGYFLRVTEHDDAGITLEHTAPQNTLFARIGVQAGDAWYA